MNSRSTTTTTATATTTSAATFDADGFAALVERSHEPDWLIEARQHAWRQFNELAWPARDSEEWYRTDIRAFHPEKFRIPLDTPDNGGLPPGIQLPEGLLREGVELAGSVVSLNSAHHSESLDPQWVKRGVIFSSLARLAATDLERIRPYLLAGIVDTEYDKFAALQGAFWMGGRVLYVPRGVTIEQPLHALSLLGSSGTDLGRTLVVLEDGAQATLLVEMASLGDEDEGLHCGATEIVLGAGANLRLVTLQDWSHRVWHFGHQKAVVNRSASLQWTVGALGSRLAKVNQHVELAGANATCQVNGVLFTEDTQHLSYHTLQHHSAPACRSDFLYKTALQDRSRTVWRGMIKVDRGAQKTDGYQRNDNLLLSRSARADSIPGLEIEADDVRCTHGSTTGRFDEEPLFYAQCRGFTRKEAIRAYVIGFFQQVFDRITIESVREALGRAIARRVREYE